MVGVAYFIGLAFFVGFESLSDGWSQLWVVLLLGGVAGLWGSLLDSLLGATVQYSGYSKEEEGGYVVHGPLGRNVRHISGRNILDNHAVNFVSSALTAITISLTVYSIT